MTTAKHLPPFRHLVCLASAGTQGSRLVGLSVVATGEEERKEEAVVYSDDVTLASMPGTGCLSIAAAR
jgi:hypothetical protein